MWSCGVLKIQVIIRNLSYETNTHTTCVMHILNLKSLQFGQWNQNLILGLHEDAEICTGTVVLFI